MKKLYVPVIFDGSTHKIGPDSCTIYPEMEGYIGYFSMDVALAAAKDLNLKKPNAKVVILESTVVVEPRKVEFAEKRFTDAGELLA